MLPVLGLIRCGSASYPVEGQHFVWGGSDGLLTEGRLDSDRHLTLSNRDRHHVYSVVEFGLKVKGFLYFNHFKECVTPRRKILGEPPFRFRNVDKSTSLIGITGMRSCKPRKIRIRHKFPRIVVVGNNLRHDIKILERLEKVNRQFQRVIVRSKVRT